MSWIKEQFNPSIIGVFLISILVGGLVMGVVDMNRPKPLFSSADHEDGSILDACLDEVGSLEDFIDSLPSPIPTAQLNNYYNQSRPYLNQVGACVQNDRVPFFTDWERRKTDAINATIAEWQPEYDEQSEQARWAWHEHYERDMELLAAQGAYDRCAQGQGDNRAASSSSKETGAKDSSQSVRLSLDNEDSDCQQLREALLVAQQAEEEALLAAQAWNERLDELRYELDQTTRSIEYEFDDIAQVYEDDAYYTIEYATDYADTPFGNVDPHYNGYYNNRGERAY